MRITGDWLTRPETQAVCRVLTEAGYRALFVGGCVRNALLGEPVADVDLSTDALPETVSDLAEKAGLKPVPTGIAHGTITVVSAGIPHEVTTFRHDVETFGRHARVAFAKTVEDDAARRDFTMNALYATPEGKDYNRRKKAEWYRRNAVAMSEKRSAEYASDPQKAAFERERAAAFRAANPS